MPNDARSRLSLANRELRNFLRRVDGMVLGQGDIGADDLRTIGKLLQSIGQEICESRRGPSADTELPALIQEYAVNLRAARTALEKVRCVMLARRARMDRDRGRVSQLQGWANAYRQTT